MNAKNALLRILAEEVPTADYINAENMARTLEQEYGRLTDLRTYRDRVLQTLDELADDIEKLKADIRSLAHMEPSIKAMVSEALAPLGDRFLADDEQKRA